MSQLPGRFSSAPVQRDFSSNTTMIGRARLHRSGTSRRQDGGPRIDQYQAAANGGAGRPHSANRFVPLERLALSPQCGRCPGHDATRRHDA